jgi:hypothetical protein
MFKPDLSHLLIPKERKNLWNLFANLPYKNAKNIKLLHPRKWIFLGANIEHISSILFVSNFNL